MTWSKQKIVEAIRAHAEEHGAPPRSTDWAAAGPGHPTNETVRNHFGSWSAGLKAAGFTPPPAARPPAAWSKEAIVGAIRAHAEAYGAPPKSRDWAAAGPGHPTNETVRNRFGSWSAGLRAAGFEAEAEASRALSRPNRPVRAGLDVDRLVELVERGEGVREIAAELGVSHSSVHNRLRELGLNRRLRRRRRLRNRLLDDLPALVGEGLTAPEIAERTGAPVHTVRKHLQRRGLKAKRAKPTGAPPTAALAELPAMLEQGLKPAEIAERTGADITTVYRHMKRRELWHLREDEHSWGKLAQLPSMVAEGLTAREIAERAGVSVDTVYAHVSKRGLRHLLRRPRRLDGADIGGMLEEGLSVAEIAKRTGACVDTVYSEIKHRDLGHLLPRPRR